MEIRKRTLALLAIAVALCTCIGTLFTEAWFFPQSNISTSPELYSDTFEQKLDKLRVAHALINEHYVRSFDENKMIDKALEGMLSSLGDQHSIYLNKEISKQFNEMLQSSISGIGIKIVMQGEHFIVQSVVKDSPAAKAGIKNEDQLERIDDERLEKLSAPDVLKLVRGSVGSEVKLEIFRPATNEHLKFNIKRQEIKRPTVESRITEEQVGVIKVSQFGKETAAEFASALIALEAEDMKSLVIDVRQNPGGLLLAVKEMLDELVPRGKTLFWVEGRDGRQQKFVARHGTERKLPIVVVIDNGSASASEILAGSLVELVGATIVGEDSWGKGTMQHMTEFDDGSSMNLTVAKWLTPRKNWIDRFGGTHGVKPTVFVEQPEYYKVMPPQIKGGVFKQNDNDPAIQAAQNVLKILGQYKGRTDGYFDEAMKEAVIQFQQQYQVQVTGKLDRSTAEKMQQALSDLKNDPKRDIQLKVAIEQAQKSAS